jgi:membrane dipeptidase
VFWELGIRMVSLTWNRRNSYADGGAEPADGGLSRLGGRLVDLLADTGMIIDLAHASVRTFFDILERAPAAPVIISHSACRAIHDVPRNVDDEQLRALAERGGVLALMALPLAIDPVQPRLRTPRRATPSWMPVLGSTTTSKASLARSTTPNWSTLCAPADTNANVSRRS